MVSWNFPEAIANASDNPVSGIGRSFDPRSHSYTRDPHKSFSKARQEKKGGLSTTCKGVIGSF